MKPISSPLALLLFGVGYLVAVLDLGRTPVGSWIAPSAAAAALGLGAVALVLAFATRRAPHFASAVTAGVSVLLVVSGGASLLMPTPDVGPSLGLIGYGVVLLGLHRETPSARRTPIPGVGPSSRAG